MSDEFHRWLKQRPRWLQTAARNILDSKRLPSDEEIEALADLCTKDAAKDPSAKFLELPEDALAAEPASARLIITSINNVKGLNSIKLGASLPIGKADLAIVYGLNGSGKSGFSKLLKQACGARAKEELLGNVFSTESMPPSAEIEFTSGDKTTHVEWRLETGPVPGLQNAHVFDSRTASMYVTEENDATYEPRRMRFVSALVSVCERVASVLRKRREAQRSSLPILPAHISTTGSGIWLSKIPVDPNAGSELEDRCAYSPEEDAERTAGTAALAEADLPGKLRSIESRRIELSRVRVWLTQLHEGLSAESIAQLDAARRDAAEKRAIAADAARAVFAVAPLSGVGLATWRAMWDQARRYSEAHAYPGMPFPAIQSGARCVLCQEVLSDGAQARLSHFETFITSELEMAASAAETRARNLQEALPRAMELDHWMSQISPLGLHVQESERAWQEYTDMLAALLHGVLDARAVAFDPNQLLEKCKVREAQLHADDVALRALQSNEAREALIARVRELEGKQWVSQNRKAIEAEIARCTAIREISAAETLAATNALTIKNGELAKSELDEGYCERFASELTRLGAGRLPVVPAGKSKGKGRYCFKLELKDAKRQVNPHHVLSEGEQRVVALSAFLADLSGHAASTPFIFDDPISSLDQGYEERVADRLVALAAERQVIVFTHRLSLLTLLEEAVTARNQDAKRGAVTPPLRSETLMLARVGSHSGVLLGQSIRDRKCAQALNTLLNECVPRLRKMEAAADGQGLREAAWQSCTDLRLVVEKVVEEVLLCDVVRRFRRAVNTKGKIGGLARIQKGDCTFIDDLMTRYSAFEHSQAMELPAQWPSADELDRDIRALKTWKDAFDARLVG